MIERAGEKQGIKYRNPEFNQWAFPWFKDPHHQWGLEGQTHQNVCNNLSDS